ncbi:hypothetical protein GOBAR_AA28101 [Gossypium barbadense]|uniref:Uncharacterized protein n=1 Tax=Gossypium barbadense TaxID=3634 RepID=A0A2P5WNH3_GOSBA|nr:hypothetical protein GOBAR_AA28101 [Gossypium barbadense]
MAIRGVDFKWYDGFFLSMLATSVIIVAINWKRYHHCAYPLHIWIVVDYSTVFIFRLLMFVDNGLAAGMGLDFGWQQRYARFCGRIVVLSILSMLLYPFLWAWTVIGTLWFTSARNCLPKEGQKYGFLIWLLFSYCGLLCIACMSVGKWMTRRQAHLLRAQQGIPISEYGPKELDDNVLPMAIAKRLFFVAHCNKRADSERSSASIVTSTQYVRTQPLSQSYLLRLQGLLRPVRTGNAGAPNDADVALDTAENGAFNVATQNSTGRETVGHALGGLSTPPHH